jgi:hypothetical protein
MTTIRLLKIHAVFSTLAIGAMFVMGAAETPGTPGSAVFDTITVRRMDVLDSADRVRVQVAGEFGPRRKDLSGMLFHNEDGHESGGLVYWGRRDENGEIQAGGMMTFDQYAEDQIMSLQYAHSGGRKRTGLTISDRPDEMGVNLARFYQEFAEADSEEERQRLREEVLPTIPPEEMPAKRLYLGRTSRNSSTINLYDPQGRVRLKLEVDQDGSPRIEFLDENGGSARTINLD